MKVILTIGKRHRSEHASFGEARITYERIRDESGEGVSTFPDGKTWIEHPGVNTPKLRISYNGRMWQQFVSP